MRLAQSLPARTPERDVVRLAGAVIRFNPDTTFYVARTLAEHGHQPVANKILSHWALVEPKPTIEQIGGLVTVARATGDPMLLWRMLPVILEKRDAAEAQAYYIEALANAFGDEAVVPLQASVSRAVFDARPLFAARLALKAGNQLMARRYLLGLRLADLPSRDQLAWLDLLEYATSQQVALGVLLDRRRKGELPADLLPKLAEFAGRLGYSGEQMMILSELARP
jgi:hypothetical protein